MSAVLQSVFAWVATFLAVVLVVLLVGFGVIYFSLKRRHDTLNRVSGPLDLTGKVYRAHVSGLKDKVDLADVKLDYEPTSAVSVRHFKCVSENTQCLFAKHAVLWGSKEWDDSVDLEANVAHNAAAFSTFLRFGKPLHFDGFVFEIRGAQYHRTLSAFGQTVRRVLTALARSDPAKGNCMSRSYIDKKGWWFEFDREALFITTFAPCYPATSSRYQFEQEPLSCFVLFQPEYSFAWRNIDAHRELATQWDRPESVRDKIRCLFRDHGRRYVPLDGPAPVLPTAFDIVKPLRYGDDCPKWWLAD